MYCKNCKYKVKYGIGCWHPLMSYDMRGEWNQEAGVFKCKKLRLFKRKYWWKIWQKKRRNDGENSGKISEKNKEVVGEESLL